MKFIIFILAALSSLSMAQSKWQLQNPWPSGSTLYSIWPSSDTKVFITGSSIVLSSDDGGKTWQTRELPSEGMGSKIFFLNYTTGWIVSPYKLSRTTDGGESWHEVATAIDMSKHFFSDLVFADERNGFLAVSPKLSSSQFIADNPGKLFKTEDGGVTWKEMPLKADGELNFVSIVDRQHIMVSGTDSVTLSSSRTCLYSSSDSGKSWMKIQPPDRGKWKADRCSLLQIRDGWERLQQVMGVKAGKKRPLQEIYFLQIL